MGFISDTYPVALTTPLATDAYHFTTPYAYWLEGRADNRAVFYMFGRKEALGGGYTVAGGLEGVVDIVKRWQESGFTAEDLDYLCALKTPSGKRKFPEEFIEYLSGMEFRLKIDAAPEGSVFFPQEPVLRVEGPVVQVKMLESVALCLMNGHSGYMTQAARQSDVLEAELENGAPKGFASAQGLRRGPALGAALESSRSLGAGGYASTSTAAASRLYGQDFAGTMDHAWVMTHEGEVGDTGMAELFRLRDEGRTDELRAALKQDAFRSFAFAWPEAGTLLVDTYDPVQGLENAITVIKELRALGLGKGYGVRFDSGDIVKYSKMALRRFAQEGWVEGLDPAAVAGMSDEDLLKLSEKCTVYCAAADGIDEHSAQQMRRDGAFFRSWGIGTAGSHVQPVGQVYKASLFDMEVHEEAGAPREPRMTPVMKIASNAPVKSSNPGRINSRRHYGADGMLSHVVVYDERAGLDPAGTAVNLRDFGDTAVPPPGVRQEDLLVPVFDENGSYVYREPPKKEAWPGAGRTVTDLSAIARFVRSQLATLPDAVRRVVRPRDVLIRDRLAALFNDAKKSGAQTFTVDMAALESSLPPACGHIPVYLDRNLHAQRTACEKKHLAGGGGKGVGSYRERFEGGLPSP